MMERARTEWKKKTVEWRAQRIFYAIQFENFNRVGRSLGLGGVTNVGKKKGDSLFRFLCMCANRVELSHWRRVLSAVSPRLVYFYSVPRCVVSIDFTTRRFKSADVNFSSRTVLGTGLDQTT